MNEPKFEIGEAVRWTFNPNYTAIITGVQQDIYNEADWRYTVTNLRLKGKPFQEDPRTLYGEWALEKLQ